MKLRHPHIHPALVVDREGEALAAHVAAGWIPVTPAEAPATDDGPTADEAPADATPDRPRRNRRAGSDLPEETAP